jgi:hypothetical protein
MPGRYDPYDFNANAPILPNDQGMANGIMGLGPGSQVGIPPSKALTKNPVLSQTPLGAYTDSQYEASHAQLRNNIAKQYADILSQIGYKDDSGQFIPGQIEADAQKQQAELQRGMGIAQEEVTQGAQREGTLFSGLRGTNQARAEHPFVSALSDLATNTPLALNKLYEQAAGLTDEYTLQNNLMLADAAARAAAGFGTQPGEMVSAPTGGGRAPNEYLDTGGTSQDPAVWAAYNSGMDYARSPAAQAAVQGFAMPSLMSAPAPKPKPVAKPAAKQYRPGQAPTSLAVINNKKKK